MGKPAIVGENTLELIDFAAENIVPALDDAPDGGVDRIPMRSVLFQRRRQRNHETIRTSGT
jgi:hypothetical protein